MTGPINKSTNQRPQQIYQWNKKRFPRNLCNPVNHEVKIAQTPSWSAWGH